MHDPPPRRIALLRNVRASHSTKYRTLFEFVSTQPEHGASHLFGETIRHGLCFFYFRRPDLTGCLLSFGPLVQVFDYGYPLSFFYALFLLVLRYFGLPIVPCRSTRADDGGMNGCRERALALTIYTEDHLWLFRPWSIVFRESP